MCTTSILKCALAEGKVQYRFYLRRDGRAITFNAVRAIYTKKFFIYYLFVSFHCTET